MAEKALLVIDLQNDYLWEKRKNNFSYDTKKLVKNVNNTINEYNENDYDIIYIFQIYPNIFITRWLIGFSIKGTTGAELYEDINVVSTLQFEKKFPNTFTSKTFLEHIKKSNYNELTICGIDECACICATAKGAIKAGFKTKIVKNATASRFSKDKLKKKRKELISLGVKYV